MRGARGAGKLRIIGGEWRGRRLGVPDLPGLRPTTDRTRETLFNWLAPRISGLHCLDLFAGSGALGLEALSRGAESCVFVEFQRRAAAQIRTSLETLGATDRGSVFQGDGLTFLGRHWPEPAPDLIFLDPPFASDLLAQALDMLIPLVGQDALVYLEYAIDKRPEALENWTLDREKKAGSVVYALYRKK